MNPYNTSLLLAWMVSMCDLVYITDAFARSTKRVYRSAITANLTLLFDYRSASSIFELFASVFKILTFVPYHILVIWELDMTSVYFLVCVLRVARLWKSGRLDIVSTFSNMEEDEHTQATEAGCHRSQNQEKLESLPKKTVSSLSWP
ncbi:hypothetical protein ACROYT_G032501 [Oculina patagonica]